MTAWPVDENGLPPAIDPQQIDVLERIIEQLGDLQRDLLHHAEDTFLALRELYLVVSRLDARGGEAAPTPVDPAEADRARRQAYAELIGRVRESAEGSLPRGATVLVVSKGDPELLLLGDRRASHFPCNRSGAYAGHHPADSATAIAHLEEQRSAGAQFLVLPATSSWWLEHYRDLADHLDATSSRVVDDDTCTVFDLRQVASAASSSDQRRHAQYALDVEQLLQVLAATLPKGASLLVVSGGDDALLSLDHHLANHFPATPEGVYDGHPADSSAAIACLEAQRSSGGEFLVVPTGSRWWADHYDDFWRYLAHRYPLVVDQRHVCQIFSLLSTTAPTT